MISRMIAWLVVAGFLFFSGLYFYDSVREYRQEKFSFDRQILELQAKIKAQDARIIELQAMVKQQNLKIENQKKVVVHKKDKMQEMEKATLATIFIAVGSLLCFIGYYVIKEIKPLL